MTIKHKPLPKYNKDEYLKKFIPLVFDVAPEYEPFLLRKLVKEMNISDDDKRIFLSMNIELNNYFVNNDYATFDKLHRLTFIEKGRNMKNGIETKSDIIYNDFTNSNVGQVIQDSDLRKARIIKNEKTVNNTPLKKSLIQKALSNPWVLLITGAVIAAVLNSDRVMNRLNNIINNF